MLNLRFLDSTGTILSDSRDMSIRSGGELHDCVSDLARARRIRNDPVWRRPHFRRFGVSAELRPDHVSGRGGMIFAPAISGGCARLGRIRQALAAALRRVWAAAKGGGDRSCGRGRNSCRRCRFSTRIEGCGNHPMQDKLWPLTSLDQRRYDIMRRANASPGGGAAPSSRC